MPAANSKARAIALFAATVLLAAGGPARNALAASATTGGALPASAPPRSLPPPSTLSGDALAADAPPSNAPLSNSIAPFTAAPAGAAQSSGGDLPPITATTSLLVVSPHPDDETLCCAGVIQRVIAAGGHVAVVWITSGDGSELSMLIIEKSLFKPTAKVRALAARRMQEARAATSLLGVPNTRQFFLGYPDGGVTHLLTDNRSAPYPAKFTGDIQVPYQDAVFPNHPYTGESLEHDFDAILDRVNPTLILAPSPADTHPDHRSTGLLTIKALSRRNDLPKAHYWIVHGGEGWPSPRTYMPSIPLNLPPAGKQLPWSAFALTDEEEARKLRAVSAYETQMRVMSPFLLTFVRTSELYCAVREP